MKQAIWKWMLAGVIALGLSPAVAVGQSQDDEAETGLGVARISLTNGDVTVRRGDSGDWIVARVNQPVLVEDSVATGAASRAELQLDSANLIRLHESSEVYLAELENRKFRVRVARGTVNYSELKDGAADVDIETPLVAVRPMEDGQYRVQVIEGGETIVTVRDGKAEVASNEGIETLGKGRMLIVRGDPTGNVEFREERAMGRDDWDRWNERRDDQLENSKSYKYVSRTITGAEDLDDHGRWVYTEPYGQVWYPTVAADWAPYRHGRWDWVDYYGWTWVGYEPWGWAPYHYGRWCHSPIYGWGWYPGYRYAHHYWSPALVGFFGWNSYSGWSAGFGFGFGNVGWFPLAPYERYHPWYGHGFRGGRGGNNIYVDNSVNIYNTYKNVRINNGTTVVDAESFSRGQVNNPQSLRSAELRRATMVRGQIPVVPAGESRGRVVRAANSGDPSARANSGLLGRNGARQSGSLGRGEGASTRASRRVPFADQQQQVAQSVRAFNESSGRREAGSVRGGAVAGGASTGISAGRSVVRGGAGDNGGDPGSVRGNSTARGSVGGNSAAPGRLGSPDATSSGAEPNTGASVRGNNDRGLFNQSRRLGTRAGTETDGANGASGNSSVRSGSRGENSPSSVRSSGSSSNGGNDGWRRFGGRETRSTAASRSTGSAGDSNSRVNRGSDPMGRSSSRVPSAGSSSSSGSDIYRPAPSSGRSRIENNSRSSSPAPAPRAPSVRSRSSSPAPSSPRAAPRSSPSPSASPGGGGGSGARSSPRTRTSPGPRSSLGSGAGAASPGFLPRTSSRIQEGPSSRATSRAANISANGSGGSSRRSANISPGRSSSRVAASAAGSGSYIPRSSSRASSVSSGTSPRSGGYVPRSSSRGGSPATASGPSISRSSSARGAGSRSYGGPAYSAPSRPRGGGYSSAPQVRSSGGYSGGSVYRGGSMPRSSAPSISRGGGGGGSWGSAGRSSGGGGMRSSGGGGVRSSGGGGMRGSGGGSVRSSGGQGGGGRRR